MDHIPFPPNSAEHVAEAAMKAAGGDHAAAAGLLVQALPVIGVWALNDGEDAAR